MKKILEINKKITNRQGEVIKDQIGREQTIGSFLLFVLDGSADKGQGARRCIDLANTIDDAIKAGKDEVCFEENNAIDFIKEKLAAYPSTAWVNVFFENVFEKSEEEYRHRNDKKEEVKK